MYTSIAHFIDKEDGWQSKVFLRYYTTDGQRVENIFEVNPSLYYEDPRGKFEAVTGEKLAKKEFKNVIERSSWIKAHPNYKLYNMLNPERQFLFDTYKDHVQNPNFSKIPQFRVHMFDIEVKVENEFCYPDVAKYPINVMTVYDSDDDIYHVWVVDEKLQYTFDDYDNKRHRVFTSEIDMLNDYIEWFANNRPDIITGWNTDNFDIPYLINRLYKACDKEYVNRCLSPIGEVRGQYVEVRGGTGVNTYRISGVTSLDYMLLYKNKFGPASAQSYKLEDVAQNEINQGKLEYDGTIQDFYKRDFETFVKYNVIDVEVIYKLDQHLRFIQLAMAVCHLGLCEYQAVLKTGPYTVGALLLEAHGDNKLMCTHNPENINKVNDGFAGGFVREPTYGFFNKGIYSLDLNSLYPSIIMTLNNSIETKVGKVLQQDDNEVVVRIGTAVKRMTNEKFNTVIKPKCIRAQNGVLYKRPKDKSEWGILPRYMDKLYAKRKAIKRNMLDEKSKLVEMKEPEYTTQEIHDQAALVQLLDNQQLAQKIALNSVYGQLGSVYSPIFDLENAEAVTITGQFIINSSMDFIDESGYGSTIYGDTDSVVGDTKVNTRKTKIVCYDDDGNSKEFCINDKVDIKRNGKSITVYAKDIQEGDIIN